MRPQPPLREPERENYAFFLALPEVDRARVQLDVKGTQFLEPLFEYSGACAGCGETPYLKLLTQLFGDRLLIANATGCSSIYGGNLPTTPYTHEPRRARAGVVELAVRGQRRVRARACGSRSTARGAGARAAARGCRDASATTLADAICWRRDRRTEAGIAAQRERVAALRAAARAAAATPRRARLEPGSPTTWCTKSVWIVGGDGWAYDIGYGGLDHVLALGRDVNVLVLDTEVYSNTGGQQSKATPLGAAAKFAVAGKEAGKKDLGLMAMAYGHVYVARVAFGAKDAQTVQRLPRGRVVSGPVAHHRLQPLHRARLRHGASALEQQKLAVECGVLAALPLRPAARRARASRRSSSTRGAAEGRARASTCATRRASAWSSSRTPRGSAS